MIQYQRRLLFLKLFIQWAAVYEVGIWNGAALTGGEIAFLINFSCFLLQLSCVSKAGDYFSVVLNKPSIFISDMNMQENILLLLFLPWLTTPLSPPSPSALSSGQAQYQELSLKASLPKYGPCWLSSLSMLSSTCTHLSEETQARLALKFTNCFREKYTLLTGAP